MDSQYILPFLCVTKISITLYANLHFWVKKSLKEHYLQKHTTAKFRGAGQFLNYNTDNSFLTQYKQKSTKMIQH